VALARARAVMALETRLAKGSLDRVARREPSNRYHKLERTALSASSPAFAWDAYFAGVAPVPMQDTLNVGWPAFFEAMQGVLADSSLEDVKTYLDWRLLHDSAALLPRAFVAETFDFYDKTLAGAQELKPRWKRCVELTDRAIGEALGRAYVERTFGAEGKTRVLTLVAALEKSLGDDLRQLDWMGAETKQQALTKLAAIANKIGYPDKWRDYSALTIERGDAMGNAQRAATFEVRRQLSKIGTRVDPTEWRMTPGTVNAYYSSLENNINFPAGILQPPFFSRGADDAVNLGGIGVVIGHELTHGFDDQGRKFDATGNLRDWWTAEDNRRFEERAKCLVDEYGGFTAVDDVKLNGKLTLGENTADNGGARVAFMALRDLLAGKAAARIDGYTPEQRFFLGFAQVWCENSSPESKRLRAQTDPHSPGRYRVNGTVANMPEFREAFGCKAPPVNQCRVW
jgi:putative endopeptidase